MELELLLLLDTETTTLEPSTGKCIEVGTVRYSLKNRCVVDQQSHLIRVGNNPAENINRIPAAVLMRYGASAAEAWACAEASSSGCDAVLAHNADFDRKWVNPSCKDLLALPWIDTCWGIDWPMQTRPAQGLIALALEHGLGVVNPHRALSDCLLIARLLTRCAELRFDVEAMLARGLRQTATFQAIVPFEERNLAKDAGFRWDTGTKQWLRKMAIEDVKALPFRVVCQNVNSTG
jgi:DNA polymerase-3 subunit epsilon